MPGEDGGVVVPTSEDEQQTGPRRRGRRPGGTDTRAQLLAAARVEFIERGYDGATVRVIAERAGVDPAMVNHWFGGKEALFTASLELPVNPAEIISAVVPGPPEEIGGRIVRKFVEIWDAAGGGTLAALMQSVASHDAAARLLREFISTILVSRIAETVAPDQPQMRAALCGSQLFGMGLLRYVLKLEPLASASHDELVAAVAPTLQRYLTGSIT
ncbi:TetR family transcriptional regulator [Pseudonocardia sp. GCM10023141]|uniref:TetR/AcrR family transcriptional regulator n=1 Tax=Pseudonocardia sp. GCM10023141 TaxID=3252653 RepID=UPI003613B5C3